MSIAYRLVTPELTLAATFYYYYYYYSDRAARGGSQPKPIDLDGEFAHTKSEIHAFWTNVTLRDESTVAVSQVGGPVTGSRALFAVEGPWLTGLNEQLYSEAYLFRIDDHFIKVRFTYPRLQREAVADQVRFLMESIEWSHLEISISQT